MILGIVSDTHGHVEFTRAAVRMLETREVQEVIHCGDIGSADIVDLFSRWPTHFVFGNVDIPKQPLQRAIEAAGQTCHDRFGTLDRADCRIAFLHGDDATLLEETIVSGRYDLVCCGHTHLRSQRREGRTLVVNPGALFRADPHSLAIVRLPAMDVVHVAV